MVKDFEGLQEQSVVVRVEKLPMNALIEVELFGEAGDKFGTRALSIQ